MEDSPAHLLSRFRITAAFTGFSVGLCFCVLLATWLRIDQILYQVLEGDEWHALHRLTHYSLGQSLQTFGNADFGIPVLVYYWLLSKLGILTELAMRMPMLLAGIGLVILLPLILRRRLDDRTLLVFSALLATSPYLVYWSRMARTYSPTLFTTFLAFAVIGLALRRPSIRSWALPAYALLCGFTVWAHVLTGPLLVTPLLTMWSQHLWHKKEHNTNRTCFLTLNELRRVTIWTGLAMALAVLPPLLGDPQALTSKTATDSPSFDTFSGTIHFWLGTDSGLVVWISLIIAASGIGRVWRASVEMRWVVTGMLLTFAFVLVAQPSWVDRPMVFARYLLPVVPFLLLAIAAGVVRIADMLIKHIVPKYPVSSTFFLFVILFISWWYTAPLKLWLKSPNSYLTHMYYQFDYREGHNKIQTSLPALPRSNAWKALSRLEKESLLIAAAPYHYATWEWPAPIWEQDSGQRVIPGFLWGACEPTRYGEVPDDGRFNLRNGVHLANRASLTAHGVDWVAYYLSPQYEGYSPRLPECEAWLRKHYGKPDFEDATFLAWQLHGKRGKQ